MLSRDGPSERPDDPKTPATWSAFVVVWCLGTMADHTGMPRALVEQVFGGQPGPLAIDAALRVLWLAAAASALLRPSSTRRFWTLCLLGSVVILTQLPRVPNHWIVQLAVYTGSLTVALVVRETRGRIATLRLMLLGTGLVVYLWTFVHKLNAGFLDPTTSCGPVFVESLAGRLDLPRPGLGLAPVAVWMVLVTEGAMPLLLMTAHGRAAAILLGIGLHYVFGLFVAGFSLLMWATYFMWLPEDALDRAVETIRRGGRRIGQGLGSPSFFRAVPGWLAELVGVVGVVAAVGGLTVLPTFRGLSPQETLLLPVAVAVGLLLVSGLVECDFKISLPRPTRPGVIVAVAIALLVAINGAVPYLGIRNNLAFSMFSNLRTENGASNHLFLPVIETPWSILDDQIEILDSSDPELVKYARPQHRVRWNWTTLITEGQRARFELPFFMVRARAQELRAEGAPPFSLEYTRGGDTVSLSPSDVSALGGVSRVSMWLHWSKGTPLPPLRNACMW
ncbi:MAG: hypothetical protein AAF436_14095 [Myxococcota bacterium]